MNDFEEDKPSPDMSHVSVVVVGGDNEAIQVIDSSLEVNGGHISSSSPSSSSHASMEHQMPPSTLIIAGSTVDETDTEEDTKPPRSPEVISRSPEVITRSPIIPKKSSEVNNVVNNVSPIMNGKIIHDEPEHHHHSTPKITSDPMRTKRAVSEDINHSRMG